MTGHRSAAVLILLGFNAFGIISFDPATIRYTATFKEGTWHEVGDRLAPGQEPVRILEMNLERVGDTDWPAADPIHPE